MEDGHVHVVDLTEEQPWAGRRNRIQLPRDSILSQLDDEWLPHSLLGFKKYFKKVKSFDLLAPQLLRRRTREVGGGLGRGRERLASVVDEVDLVKHRELVCALQTVYPQLVHFDRETFPEGWKQIQVDEAYRGQEITTGAQHINDGMFAFHRNPRGVGELRSFVLFDEIENGINPEVVEFVIDKLV